MKPAFILITAILSATFSTHAAEPEAPKKQAGPNGGRLITSVSPHAEFVINKDQKVEIRFIGQDGKVIAPAGQVASIIMGDRSAPTRLTFTQNGDALISNLPIPEGNNHPTVLQIRSDAAAQAVTEKFNLNLSPCPECDLLEYACICDHS